MADFGPIIGDALSAYALIGGSNRSLGTIMPHVAIEEVHHDTAVLTQHPVATGSPITDHMYLMPKMVEVRWGWSDSTAMAEGYCIDVYNELLSLQQKRKPFPISTGWRQYKNMQIVSLTAKNDVENPNALLPIAVCQEIIMADIQTTGGSGAGGGNGGAAGGGSSPTDGAGTVTTTDNPGSSVLTSSGIDTSGGSPVWSNDVTDGGTKNLSTSAGSMSVSYPAPTDVVGHH